MTRLVAYNSIDIAEIDRWLDDDAWHLQQKIDGMRARLIVKNGLVEVFSSEGKPLISGAAAPTVVKIKEFASSLKHDIELEGEIVDGCWFLFDYPSGPFTSHLTPWVERSAELQYFYKTIPSFHDWLKLIPTWETVNEKRQAWQRIVSSGVEGGVLKHISGRIDDGDRVSDILKAKITHTVDCFVLERGPGNGKNGSGNWMKVGLIDKDGEVIEVGRCSIIGKPYAAIGDVVELRYLYVGTGGRLVQPTHLRLRLEKEKEDCSTEQLRFVNKKILEA